MTETNTNPAVGAIRESFVSEREFAQIIGKSLRTVRRWAALREGPSRLKQGRTILYSRRAIEKWLAESERPCRRPRGRAA